MADTFDPAQLGLVAVIGATIWFTVAARRRGARCSGRCWGRHVLLWRSDRVAWPCSHVRRDRQGVLTTTCVRVRLSSLLTGHAWRIADRGGLALSEHVMERRPRRYAGLESGADSDHSAPRRQRAAHADSGLCSGLLRVPTREPAHADRDATPLRCAPCPPNRLDLGDRARARFRGDMSGVQVFS